MTTRHSQSVSPRPRRHYLRRWRPRPGALPPASLVDHVPATDQPLRESQQAEQILDSVLWRER